MKESNRGLLLFCTLLIGLSSNGDAQFLGQLLGIPRFRNQQAFAPQYQQYQQQQQQASVSTAESEAYNRDLQLGLLGLNGGRTVSESQTVDSNGGLSFERTGSNKNGIKLGNLDISNTVTGSRGVNNGQFSGQLGNNFKFGQYGVDSSLSANNLQNGFGLRRSENGGLELGLGFLNVDLTRNNEINNNENTGTTAEVNAEGEAAVADAQSDTNQQTDLFGTLTHSKSKAQGSALNGITSGKATGTISGTPSSAGSGGLFPHRRFVRQGFYFPAENGGFNQGFNDRERNRNHHHGGRHRDQQQFNTGAGAQGFGQEQQFNTGAGAQGFGQPQQVTNDAQGFANGNAPGFMQQAAANTNSENNVNEYGQTQNNNAASISSNLADDGSSGQVSSANTAQQSYQNNDGTFGDKNAAQSQSVNFEKDHTQATSSNSDTSYIKDDDSERSQANSGSSVMEQGLFGTSANSAQTNTNTFSEEGGREGSDSNSNSQSTLTGPNGQLNTANTGTKTSSVKNADGSISNISNSQAAGFSNNGGPVSVSASSSSGSGPNGSFNNAQGLSNANGANSNGFTQSGFQGFPGFQGFQGGRQQFRPFGSGGANAFG